MDVLAYNPASLSEAQLSDAGPLLYLRAAILERGGTLSMDNSVFGRRPNVAVLREMIDAIYALAPGFIDLSADYTVDYFYSFPHYYTALDIETSPHPMLLCPAIGSTPATPRAMDAYRTLLCDLYWWLQRLRYRAPEAAWCTTRISGTWTSDGVADVAASTRRSPGVSLPITCYSATATAEATCTTDEDGQASESERWTKSAEEYAGVWIINSRPIPATSRLVWMYSGAADGLQGLDGTLYGHPGTVEEEWRSHGRTRYDLFRIIEQSCTGKARFSEREVEYLSGSTTGTTYTLTSRKVSPDGTQFLDESTQETFTPYENASFYLSGREKRGAAETGWTHAPGVETGPTVPAFSRVCLLPDSNSVSEPATPSATLDGGAGNIRAEARTEVVIGPLLLFPVLDYGPHYHYAPAMEEAKE